MSATSSTKLKGRLSQLRKKKQTHSQCVLLSLHRVELAMSPANIISKPLVVGEEDTGCGTCNSMRRRRMEKRVLHAGLHKPKDLFWDAVWIQPEDIIREVTPHTGTLGNNLCLVATAWL